MKKYLFALPILMSILLFSCLTDSPAENESGPIIMPINPNGDSELALLMRDMFEEGLKAKEKIKSGELPDLVLDFEKIHTAQATEPEKAASPEYKVHALSYLQAVAALKNADKNNLEKSYTDMVDACMSCHKAVCPGPTVKIKKLYL
ncbi:MAG: hypothetical protein R2788_27560 [Saprospiraceae bacterium]